MKCNVVECIKANKEAIKRFLVSIFKQAMYIVLMFLAWMSLEDMLLPVLYKISDSTISKLHMEWVICATLLVTLLFFIYFVPKFRNKYQISKWFLSNLILISLIYTRYRNYSDEFVFWGCNKFYYLDLLYAILIVLLVYSFFTYIIPQLRSWCKGESNRENLLLRDDEIDDPEKDYLGYNRHVENLANLLETVDVSKRAYSVGIVGEWGIGKSSLLKLFEKYKTGQSDIVVRFNPRHAKNTNLIQEDFFNQLRAKLSKYSGNVGIRIDKYAYALQLTTPSKWLYAIWDLFTNWTADAEKQRINEVLRSLHRKIYIIIEDLDRLTGEEILEVLKLIDANGNFCNTFFLTAYDKNYVNGVLKRTLKLDDDTTDYTDKYFHYEFPLMEQSKIALKKKIDDYIYTWAMMNTDLMSKFYENGEWNNVCNYLVENISTLRQLKRFTNLLYSVYPKRSKDVVFIDFLLLTLIRFLDYDAYLSIYYKRFLSKSPPNEYFSDYSALYLIEGYEDVAKSYSRINNFAKILSTLFTPKDDIQLNRIYRMDAFDNYFYENIEGKKYFDDYNVVMSQKLSLEQAFEELSKHISAVENSSDIDAYNVRKGIEDFLCFYEPEWMGNRQGLERYICLLIWYFAKTDSYVIENQIGRMMREETIDKYTTASIVNSRQEYIEIIKKAISKMLEATPYQVGMIMIRRLNARKAGKLNDERGWDVKEENIKMALLAQKEYDLLYGKEEWTAAKSYHLSLIDIGKTGMPIDKAIKQLKSMMIAHPDDYVKHFLRFESNFQFTYTIIDFSYDFIRKVIGVRKINSWIKSIKLDDLRFIVSSIADEVKKGKSPRLNIKPVKDDQTTNYKLIAQLVKESLDKKMIAKSR